MRILKTFAISISLPALLAFPASAAQLSIGPSVVFLDNDGPNNVGILPGQNFTPLVGNVEPNLGTIITATQGAFTVRLGSLFAQSGLSNSRDFAIDVPLNSGLSGSWDIVAVNILETTQTATQTTNSLTGVSPLARPANLTVNNPVNTGTLSPMLNWTNPAGSFTNNNAEVYDTETGVRLAILLCGGGNLTCDSIQIPNGMLAPGRDYSLRALADERADPFDFFTATRRSNSFIDHTATSSARESGDILIFDENFVDTGFIVSPGANNFPNTTVRIGSTLGPAGVGAVRLGPGDFLTTSFVTPGFDDGSFGNLVVDGGTINLDGPTVTGPALGSNGGFLTVGRSGTGYAFFSDGATVNLNAAGQPFPGFQAGRNPGSFGHIVVEGAGTTITVDGSTIMSSIPREKGLIVVGRAGTGRLDLADGAVVSNDPNGLTSIGVSLGGVGGRGTVAVNGAGTVLNAGAVLDLGDPLGNGGLGRLSVENGGVVTADVINVHAGGILTGDDGTLGSLINNVMVNVLGGVVSPGASPGTMNIIGDLVLTEGALILEADSASLFDQLTVTGDLILDGGKLEVVLGYAPSGPLDFFNVLGATSIGAGFDGVDVFAPLGSGVAEGTMVTVDIGGNLFTVGTETPQVATPATLVLLGPIAALAGLTLRRRSRGSPAA